MRKTGLDLLAYILVLYNPFSSSELSDQESDKASLDLDSLIGQSMSDSKKDDLIGVSGVA